MGRWGQPSPSGTGFQAWASDRVGLSLKPERETITSTGQPSPWPPLVLPCPSPALPLARPLRTCQDTFGWLVGWLVGSAWETSTQTTNCKERGGGRCCWLLLYIMALFSALEQTRCALVTRHSKWVTGAIYSVIWLSTDTAVISGRSVYTVQPCTASRRFMQGHIRMVHACFVKTLFYSYIVIINSANK